MKLKQRAEASLEQLQQLNPYVRISTLQTNLATLNDSELQQLLSKYQCVVLTEISRLNRAIQINDICRQNDIKFLMSDVHGLFGWSFTDFASFEIMDSDGEEYKEQLIGSISAENEHLIIETIDRRMHDLETNDLVEFNQIKGLVELNQNKSRITSLNPFKFSIETPANLSDLSAYQVSGYFKKVKIQKKVQFEPLSQQLAKPNLVLSELSEQKFQNPYLVHVALHALSLFLEEEKSSLNEFKTILNELKVKFEKENQIELSNLDQLAQVVFFTRNSVFPPLCAFFGGLVGQEVLKSITNKFTPIQQFLNLDYVELFELASESSEKIQQIYRNLTQNDRFDNLRHCFGGEQTVQKLAESKLFMVGCGAIGCEMLKNYALLGVGSSPSGYISITDHDLIEKSNLNRQFLFRQHDIQKSKSVAATAAVLKMNPALNIKTYEKKVSVQTEAELFSDRFFQSHDVCVNALDNLEARRYMDSRCVSNQKPLLESGTLGPKGHVQVIVPHVTESYSSQRDPVEADVPYCTLKSFPANIDHCIQWARDKFESNFTLKPTMFEKFLKENSNLEGLVERIRQDENLVVDGLILFVKMLKNYCSNWKDCLLLARKKFEKYYPNKAKDLLNHYPLDHLMKDGTLFWKSPKRPPHVIKFDANNEMHLDFVRCCARLYAEIFQVEQKNDVDVREFLSQNGDKIPLWQAKNKHIETDETKKKEENVNTNSKELNNFECAEILENFIARNKQRGESRINVINFEKDYEPNGHIEFIYLTSNLRAFMYSIDQTDKLTCKKIAGKIIPAIATTTSCIAGLATVELVKLVQKNDWRLDMFRNVFLNLGISFILLSEPGACVKSKIAENCYVSLWDKWAIKGNKTFTLKNFIETVSSNYKLTVSGSLSNRNISFLLN